MKAVKRPLTWNEFYKFCEKEWEKIIGDSARFEIPHIFWHLFGVAKSDIILNGDLTVNERNVDKFLEILKKRKSGTPLQYALGKWEFMGIDLKVGEGVLIPREDTSVLVNSVLKNIEFKNPAKIIDLCSGSGCVALALEKNVKSETEIYAAELSEKAFGYLKSNCLSNCSKVNLINDDIFNCYKRFEDGFFDAVVSNPPYIPKEDIKNLQPEVHFEPILALDGGYDGLEFYRKICKYWIPKISCGGILAFEVGVNQSEDVEDIMNSYGIKTVKKFPDINNIPRVVLGIKNSDQ